LSLREVVAIPTGTLLEIMNYNVEGQQYACAGELIGLQAMTNVLNLIQKIDIAKLTETFSIEKVKEILRFRNHTLSIHDTFGQVFFPSVPVPKDQYRTTQPRHAHLFPTWWPSHSRYPGNTCNLSMARRHHLVSTKCSRNGAKTITIVHHLSNAKCAHTSSLWSCWLTNARLQFAGVGSRGSALTVVRFNQGSKQDVGALVDYIYATLGMDLDYILPACSIYTRTASLSSSRCTLSVCELLWL